MTMPYDDAQNPAHRWITQYQHVTGTVGLYTHKDGNYSFIEVREDSVYAAGITFTETGIKLLEDYKAKWGSGSIKPEAVGDINQQLIEETYLMSQALYHSSWIKIADFEDPVQGATHMYGWHFNWDGSKAVVVTNVSHWHYGGNENTIYVDRQEYFVHEVSINEDQDGILTTSLELLETADAYIRDGELRVWLPNNSGTDMQVDPIIDCSSFTSYDLVAFDAPLYGFYKPDGNIRLIRFFRELSPAKTYEEAIDEAADVNCPDRGWTTSEPTVIEGTYEGRTTTSTAGFRVDDTTISATEGGGYYRKRRFSRAKTGTKFKNSRSNWHDSQISIWTQTEWEEDCTIDHDCAFSGPIYETEEVECIYDEEVSTSGGPNIGDTTHTFALIIEGRSTDSVAMVSWQQTYKTMTTRHREEIGHDSIQQVHREGDAVWNEECNTWVTSGSTFGPKAQFIMPSSGCAISDVLYVTVPEGDTCQSHTPISTVSSESSYLITTKAYIANPYEVVNTDTISTTNPAAGNPYGGYLTPTICPNVASENLWFDVLSFSGRSVRKELEGGDVENIGSNCEIDVDLPGTTAFWLGAT